MISTGAPGIDLTALPAIMTAEELARAIRSSVGALAQDRFRRQGCPYIRLGRRIRYVLGRCGPVFGRQPQRGA